jgi:hypothetical protein
VIAIGKWILTALLLLSVTLPFTTCDSSRGVQEHHLDLTFETIFVFFWPIPFLLFRLSRRWQPSIKIAVAECLAAASAWLLLFVKVAAAAVASLGGIAPASGYVLATSSLAGYFVLSLVEILTMLRATHGRGASPSPDRFSPA